VRVDLDFTGIIENSDYQAWSNQVSEPVGGEPVLTEVVRWFGVEVTPDYHGATWPAGVVEYVHSLTNTGVNSDTFRLGLVSSQGWGSLDLEQVLVAPGETVEITVQVNVPLDASPGLVDQTVLTASSMGDPRASTLVTDTTTVVEDLIHIPVVEK
jgi:uncharacterized membrane protein